MDYLPNVRASVFGIIGVVGGMLIGLLGGWDMALQTLLMLMILDYGSGLLLAGVFHKSKKTETGSLSSTVGWKGITKKVMTLVFVLVGSQVDKLMGTDTVRYGIIMAYIVIEGVSLVENAGLMGMPVPKILLNAIDILKKNEDIVTTSPISDTYEEIK